MKPGNLKFILSFIFIIALALRLAVVFTQEESKKLPLSDAKQYSNIAVNIVSGRGFSERINGKLVPTARRMPVYPLFLAGVYKVFGLNNYNAAKIIQAILGALLCFLIFLIAYLTFNSYVVGIIASGMTAIYKPYVSGFNYYGGPAMLPSEYFYTFMVAVSIFTLIFFLKRENHIMAILAGFCIGLAILTRAEFIFYPMVLFFYLFYECKWSIKGIVKRFFVFYLSIILVLMPWVIRNYIVYKRVIPLATYHGGIAFWTGNNSVASGGWAYPLDYKETMQGIEKLGEYEQNQKLFRKGFEELRRNPAMIPLLFVRKILVHWAPFEDGFKIFNAYYAAVLLLGTMGILFFRRRTISEGGLIGIFVATSLVAIVIYGDPRYRYPYEPYLIIFASRCIYEIFLKRSFVSE